MAEVTGNIPYFSRIIISEHVFEDVMVIKKENKKAVVLFLNDIIFSPNYESFDNFVYRTLIVPESMLEYKTRYDWYSDPYINSILNEINDGEKCIKEICRYIYLNKVNFVNQVPCKSGDDMPVIESSLGKDYELYNYFMKISNTKTPMESVEIDPDMLNLQLPPFVLDYLNIWANDKLNKYLKSKQAYNYACNVMTGSMYTPRHGAAMVLMAKLNSRDKKPDLESVSYASRRYRDILDQPFKDTWEMVKNGGMFTLPYIEFKDKTSTGYELANLKEVYKIFIKVCKKMNYRLSPEETFTGMACTPKKDSFGYYTNIFLYVWGVLIHELYLHFMSLNSSQIDYEKSKIYDLPDTCKSVIKFAYKVIYPNTEQTFIGHSKKCTEILKNAIELPIDKTPFPIPDKDLIEKYSKMVPLHNMMDVFNEIEKWVNINKNNVVDIKGKKFKVYMKNENIHIEEAETYGYTYIVSN